jgi:hypothetical protein
VTVYISASDYYKALGLKTLLHERTEHRVAARWILEPNLEPNRLLNQQRKDEKARRNLMDIAECEIYILMDDHDMVPGGKHFEMGVAHHSGNHVFVLGRREHLYCHMTDVVNCPTLEELVTELKKLKE